MRVSFLTPIRLAWLVMNANASRGLTLSQSHPKVAADWDADRNAPLTLSDVNAFSKQRVWWKCPSGHEYEVSVATRVRTGGCKVCRRPAHVEKARRTKLASVVERKCLYMVGGLFSRFWLRATGLRFLQNIPAFGDLSPD